MRWLATGTVALALAGAAVAGGAAWAAADGGSAEVGEVVVTAQKVDYDAARTPSVVLRKRADNLITAVRVVCDTRDLSQRKEELKATLRNMIRSAKASGVELGIGEEVIGVFDETMLDAVIAPDRKVDTSVATLIVKTHVAPGDTFDSATHRIEAFIDKTPKAGRTEILREDEWNLTLINPQQYRPDVIALVSADANRTAAVFGPGYGASVEGLQLPLSWYQSGPLELALFIPYRMTVQPVRPQG